MHTLGTAFQLELAAPESRRNRQQTRKQTANPERGKEFQHTLVWKLCVMSVLMVSVRAESSCASLKIPLDSPSTALNSRWMPGLDPGSKSGSWRMTFRSKSAAGVYHFSALIAFSFCARVCVSLRCSYLDWSGGSSGISVHICVH